MRIFFQLSCLSFLLAFWGCANQVTPTGGKKDTTPPKLLKSVPVNSAPNFKDKEIILTFNEFLLNVDPSKVYITPELSKPIKISQAHKDILLKLTPPYRDSTTYTIHFNDAIADLNEGNKMPDFDFVFSSGPVIDSLSMEGNVTDAFTGKPLKDVLVMLYSALTDSAPIKTKPLYFARSAEKGSYIITHIKKGVYKAFALRDKDGDLKYSQASEPIGFIDSSLNIRKNFKNINFKIFIGKANTLKTIRSSCLLPGEIFLKWSQILPGDVHIRSNESKLIYDSTIRTDSMMLYALNTNVDSVKLFIEAGAYKDTQLIMMKAPAAAGRNKMALVASNNLFTDKAANYVQDSLIISFNHPIEKMENTGITFVFDTGKYKRLIPLTPLFGVLHKSLIYPLPTTKPGERIQCIIRPKTLTDIFGLSNTDTIQFKFYNTTEEQKGNLALHIKGVTSIANPVLFFMKDNHRFFPTKVMHETPDNLTFIFRNLLPGAYTVYMIDDIDRNGLWDAGDYLRHQQPEPAFNHAGSIIIRSNWDNELIWDTK